MAVKWVYFPLHPETPSEGRSLTDLFKGREDRIAAFQTQMQTLMDAEGLPYGQRSMTWNSRLAQELAAWGDTLPGGSQRLHDLLYRAYFVDNLNIGDVDVLTDIAGKAGLDAAAAREVLEQRTFSGKVDDDWRRAATSGITGVPSFVSENLCVVGAQPYEVLMRFVNHLRGLRAG